MPIFMDRHDVSEEVTAEIVAQLHQADLKIQHKFNCRGLTYWFDDERKTAFCLVEAPDKTDIQKMHDHAHGAVAHKIIEVDGAVVESFLGRIEDPEKSQKTALNIINDPAFRTIMITDITCLSLKDERINLFINNQNKTIIDTIHKFKGSLVKQKADYFLISFDSVTNAVLCALETQKRFKEKIINRPDPPSIKLHIGLSAGIPVSEKENIFEDTIQMAERLCNVVQGQVVATSEVNDLYESENLNIAVDNKYMRVINKNDEKFINLLIDYTEREWNNAALNGDEFSKYLGYSKSQIYRKMISLTGKSPNSFIKAYRLNKALKLLNKNNGNISEIAYETGFATPAYFSKCFQKAYGILPSVYTKTVYPAS